MDTLNQYDVRNQHPEVRQQSQGARWSRLSLRFLAIVCNSANIGFAAYYYTNWTIGLLIMMGPPVRAPRAYLACQILTNVKHD